MLSFKLAFPLSSFTLIKRPFSSSLLSVITLISSAYLRLLILLPTVLIPSCDSSSLAFLMMISASPAEHLSHSGPAASFFLKLLVTSLCTSPVAYWTPSNLGHPSPGIISFCFFIQSMRFSRQKYWRGLPFPSPVTHILSELFSTTHPPWVALHGVALSFIELDKPLHHDKVVIHEGGTSCMIPFI